MKEEEENGEGVRLNR